MDELPYIDSVVGFQEELQRIHAVRKSGKLKAKRKYALTEEQRLIIYSKTAGLCHVCGDQVEKDKFEADHVKSHTSGGASNADNFLPACSTCNNYRWHYLPQEFKWILKLGVWARTEIANDTKVGKSLASVFIAKEIVRETRRKNPRNKIDKNQI